MSTKALSSIVPGGSAAGSALGYRLMTLSGVPGPDAGFALATAGLGSAVVLNLVFWASLVVSIPIRGVNGGYATAAIAGDCAPAAAAKASPPSALPAAPLRGQLQEHRAERASSPRPAPSSSRPRNAIST